MKLKEWNIRFKRRVRGFDPEEDPKYPAIGRSIQHLDTIASAQGWQPLTAFVSEDPDVAIDLLDDEEEIKALIGRDLKDDEDEYEAVTKKLGKVR